MKNAKLRSDSVSNHKHVFHICTARESQIATSGLLKSLAQHHDLGENISAVAYLNSNCWTVFFIFCFFFADWSSSEHGQVHRQLSVSSDSKLLDDDIREETRVIMRPKKPPRPKSEVFLNKHSDNNPRRKRFSAFGVSQLNFACLQHTNGITSPYDYNLCRKL